MLQVGCDVCQITTLDQMLSEEPNAVERIFNPEERQYAQSQAQPAQHLAAVYAAKEALGKAVREPDVLGKYYREVTVCHQENGAPLLRLSDRLAEALSSRGITVTDLSISHDGDYAVATVLVERKPLHCDRCQRSLANLVEERVADVLIPVVNQEGISGYRCPVCLRGW